MIKEIDTSYIPLNTKTLRSGQVFGPHNYKISQQSHKNHLNYVKKGNNIIYCWKTCR